MKIVTRSEWRARSPRYRNTGKLDGQSTGHWNGPKITVGGKITWDHSVCAGLVRGIQNFHMDGRGWSDIAYNYLVCPHGFVYEGRGVNIINGANGTNSGNRSSHAICMLAGQGNPFPDEEKLAYKECVSYISMRSLAPNSSMGHRDHKSTECPGDERYKWVHAGMPVNELPETIEKDDEMLLVSYVGKVYLVSNGKIVWIPEPGDLLKLRKLNILDWGDVSQETWRSLCHMFGRPWTGQEDEIHDGFKTDD
jgi:hypothetical protein